VSDIGALLRGALSGGSPLALPFAFAAGVITSLNPCCVAIFPAGAATCCAVRAEKPKVEVSNAVAFAGGMALATSFLGVAAALAGKAMTGLGGGIRFVVALVPILMGAHLIGLIRLPLPASNIRPGRRGVFGALLAGFMLSLVIVPCGTPVLASVLSYAAYEGSVTYGGLLLFLYGLGAGVPVILLGTAMGNLAQRLDRLGWRKRVDQMTGVFLLGVGVYLIADGL
jgi:cytochrome c biogenesis protein CcdA